MITEYLILTNETAEGLELAVNEAIGDGWQPLGGIAFYLDVRIDGRGDTYPNNCFIQAIARYNHPPAAEEGERG